MKYLIIALFVVSCINLKASEKIGYGIEASYNLPINEVALGLRMHISLSKNFFLSPQLSYFPGFNEVHEVYGGLGFNYNFTPDAIWGIYPTLVASYGRWFNHNDFQNSIAQANNFIPEGGIGVVKNFGCLRPFVEYRVNPNWWESNVRFGILFYFSDCFDHSICPAYSMKW